MSSRTRSRRLGSILTGIIQGLVNCCGLVLPRNKRVRWSVVILGALLVAYILYLLFFIWFYRVSLPEGLNEDDYPPFEPEITGDFPTVERSGKPRIPHVIHQTYKNEYISSSFVQYIQSFVKENPDWEYYLWTDDSARKLIAERHPSLLPTWDSYTVPVHRADALRYVVLYEFGGIYADTDFECLRPLDRLTYKYACIFPPEPSEMSVISMHRPFFINNAFMMCRAKHPFLKQMIENLPIYQALAEQIDVAGPAFVTSQFILYNKLHEKYGALHTPTGDENSPYFFKGNMSEEDDNAVYVPNSKYFFNILDNHAFRILRMFWRCRTLTSSDFHKIRACLDLQRRCNSKRNEYAFTEHHWVQSYGPKFKIRQWFTASRVHIKDIVKHYKLY